MANNSYDKPVSLRLLFVAAFALGLFYFVSHKSHKCQCNQAEIEHHDADAGDSAEGHH